MALDTTLGGRETESYGTLEDYRDHLARFYPSEASRDDEADEAALRMAFLVLDWSFDWRGERASQDQAGRWPRYVNHVTTWTDDGYFAPDEVPKRIVMAQLELARLIRSGTDFNPVIELGTIRMQRAAAGPASISTTYAEIFESPRAVHVHRLIGYYHTGPAPGTAGSTRMVLG